MTRVAAGDPELWQQIVTGNAPAVVHLLGEVRDQLDELIAAVSQGRRDELDEILARAWPGTAAIPGKHGGPARPTASVFVSVPDQPGELARLFADAGEAASTSRTCASTTTRAARSAWSSWSSPRTAASTCWARSNLGDG